MPSTKKQQQPGKRTKTTFLEAARKEGFMKSGGSFKPLPKRGSEAYNRIKKQMAK